MSAPQDSPSRWSVSPRAAILVLLLLSTAAFAARVVPIWPQIFPATGGVRLLGADPYFHLRQARFVAQNFPHLERWDIGTHYPQGIWSDAVGLFDVAMGAAAWLIDLGEPTNEVVDQVAAWTPPLLAALSIWLLYLLARTMVGRPTALLAAAIFVLYPGFWLHKSLLGFADHHVAEVVLALLTAWGLMRCLQRGELSKPASPWWRPAFEHAWPMALFLFTWIGAPIYLLLIFLALMLIATVEISLGANSNAAATAGFRYGSALLIMAVVSSTLWPDLVMFPRIFTPSLLGCAVIALAPATYVLTARLTLRRWYRPRLVALLAAVAAVTLATLVVSFVDEARLQVGMLLASEGTSLAENRIIEWRAYSALFGAPGLLALTALPLGLWRTARHPADRFLLVPLVFGVLLGGLWLKTNDYEHIPPVFVALMAAFAIAEAARLLATRHGWRLRWAGATVLVVALLCPIWPLRLVVMPWATTPMATVNMMATEAWVQAMAWMRQNTPKPSLPINSSVKPFETKFGYPNYSYPPGAYGVFTAWDFGNIVNTLGERIPVWSRWPTPFTARWLVSRNEEQSLRLLCRRCEPSEEVRYVVLDARTIAQHFLRKVAAAGRRLKDYDAQTGNAYSLGADIKIPQRTYGPLYERSMAVRLFQNDARNLGHYRLVYESPRESYITYFMRFKTNEFGRVAHDITSDLQREVAIHRARAKHVALDGNQFEYDGIVTASVKIFEVVQGAHLIGDARAGTVAEIRLQLRCGSSKRSVEYVRSAVAGSDGSFDLVVAHSSEPATDNTTCEAMGPYTLLTRNSSEVEAVPVATIAVTARQVRDGTRIELGELFND